eukprot:NODE_17_length_48642_cov_1.199349.p3 type:complete len:800 gc:universal NODE_17_length_48642_cov_1.199349:6069-8468(+)
MSASQLNGDDLAKIFGNGNNTVQDIFEVRNVTIATNVCRYIFTKEWSCDKGNYCGQAQSSFNCTGGFWCPSNSLEPIACCPGFYCNSPSEIALCPENYYCPIGSSAPIKCYTFDSCPAGSQKPQRYTIYLGIAIMIVVLSLLFYLLKKRHMFSIFEKRRDLLILEQMKLRLKQDAVDSLDVTFENLSLKIDGKNIIKRMSGKLRHGKLCAILGLSGSGKSSFFSLLLKKFKANNSRFTILGEVTINGLDINNFRNKISYVPQEDIMLEELTVDNVLRHSAFMRLKNPREDKEIKVLETIKLLGLSQVMNNKTNELSGGQKKRCNLGLELCSDPNILLLDEPTSGLDSSTSNDVCMIMKKLAKERNMTVASIIHCPSVKSWKEFDDVIVLSKGHLVFQGPADLIVEYFSKMGYTHNGEHPPEYVLDILSGNIGNKKYPWMRDIHLPELWTLFNSREIAEAKILALKALSKEDQMTQKLSSIPKFFSRVSGHIYLLYETFIELFTVINSVKTSEVNATSQFILLTKRSMKQLQRNPKKFTLDSIVFVISGFISSAATSSFSNYIGRYPPNVCLRAPVNLKPMCNKPIDFLPNALALMSLAVFFSGIMAAIPTFGDELKVYIRECHSGTSPKAYYLSKLLVDFFRMLFASILFTSTFILYWDGSNSFKTIGVVVFLLYFVGFAMGYFISVLLPRESAGIYGAGFALIFGYLFSGVQPSLSEIGQNPFYQPFQIFWSTSASRYAIEAIYISNVSGLPWEELKADLLPNGYAKSHFNINIVLVFSIGVMWHLMTLFLLIRLKNK